MSDMYKKEVPLYGDLLDIVRDINREYMEQHPGLEDELGNLDRVSEERHGAIRLGKPEELAMMARLFEVMGMYPVGYYDLSVANLPVHSTAFRPVDKEELAKNPFRVFTSLLRTDLLEDDIREQAQTSLAGRDIYTARVRELIAISESQGGLTPDQAAEFIAEALETFRWHRDARVSQKQYETFLQCNSLVADIASFKGPHINHLTPRVLNIEALHKRMQDMGIETIPEIQGPPAGWPVLLQQTSFRALVESTRFPDTEGGYSEGRHRARFGEIEQRHVALKPEGMSHYDRLTAIAQERKKELIKEGEKVYQTTYPAMLTSLFEEQFPARTLAELRQKNLGYFVYELTEKGRGNPDFIKSRNKSKRLATDGKGRTEILEEWIEKGLARALPVTYEDFLPVSAAGIFKSNLDEKSGLLTREKSSNQELFEQALGKKVADYHELYRAQEEHSIKELFQS